jgi:hypothetical protein
MDPNNVEKGIAEYKIRLQRLKWLRREAKSLDMELFQFNRERRQFLERRGVQDADSETDGAVFR